MTLDDGTVKTLETTPPRTDAIELKCLNGVDHVLSRYWEEAAQIVVRSACDSQPPKQFFYENRDRSCHKVEATLNLRSDGRVESATIERKAYGGSGNWTN